MSDSTIPIQTSALLFLQTLWPPDAVSLGLAKEGSVRGDKPASPQDVGVYEGAAAGVRRKLCAGSKRDKHTKHTGVTASEPALSSLLILT